jgi:hypothetical protein
LRQSILGHRVVRGAFGVFVSACHVEREAELIIERFPHRVRRRPFHRATPEFAFEHCHICFEFDVSLTTACSEWRATSWFQSDAFGPPSLMRTLGHPSPRWVLVIIVDGYVSRFSEFLDEPVGDTICRVFRHAVLFGNQSDVGGSEWFGFHASDAGIELVLSYY